MSEKEYAIQAVEDGQLKKGVAEQFGILSALNSSRTKSRQGEFPHPEECVLKWVLQCRGQVFCPVSPD